MVKYWKSFEYRVRNLLRELFRMPEVERVPLSGRLDAKYLHTKGDIMNFPALVEVKSTKNQKQHTIKKEWLDKLIAQARSEQKLPILIFGYHNAREIYAIIPMREWQKTEMDLESQKIFGLPRENVTGTYRNGKFIEEQKEE